jgi:hypothetical protein
MVKKIECSFLHIYLHKTTLLDMMVHMVESSSEVDQTAAVSIID